MSVAPLILMCLTFAPQDAKADAPKLKAAFDQAKICADATVAGDVEKIASLTHPAILKLAGGKAKMIETVKKSMSDMKANGFQFEEFKAEPAKSILKVDSGLYCILPTTGKVSVNGKRVKLNSFLLGASTDDGKTWKFVDGNGGENALRQAIPEIPKELKFPPRVEPKIEE